MNSMQQRLERSKLFPDQTMRLIACSDNGEDLVPIRSTERIIAEPIWEKPVDPHEGRLYSEYISKKPAYRMVYVRASVLDMLNHAGGLLPDRFKLIVRAGHRPLVVQKKLLKKLAADYKVKHPSSSQAEALEFARTYVSDPDIAVPPHCCGAAIDVDLYDCRDKILVDLGCPMNTDSEAAFLHSGLIGARQRTNRMMLLEAMLAAGFASNPAEWWHYSYGDQRWAWFYSEPKAFYDIKEPKL